MAHPNNHLLSHCVSSHFSTPQSDPQSEIPANRYKDG